MATYVLSDVHGHAKTLDRALDAVSPGADDQIYVLGDMIDRGPDPVEVVRIVRSLPKACVLRGNHEQLMLEYLADPRDTNARVNWEINGGTTTRCALDALRRPQAQDIVEWCAELPYYATCWVAGRRYLLVHAGISPEVEFVPDAWGDYASKLFLAAQDPEDLLWIREGYLDRPTGLVDAQGRGPCVVAGHTPTILGANYFDVCEVGQEEQAGRAHIARLGANQDTGGVCDRIDIDCGCAAGPGIGRLLVLRLDDMAEYYEDVRDGE